MTTKRPIPELLKERKLLAAKIVEMNRQLEELDAELFSRLDSALSAFGLSAGVAQETEKPEPPRLPPLPPPAFIPPAVAVKPIIRHGEIGEMIQARVSDLLKQVGRPMKTPEVYDRLLETGFQVPGNNPTNNLSAHLSRSPMFESTSKGWVLKEQTPPEGGV